MINNQPNAPRNKDGKLRYKQGNYIPENKDKVIKLNSKGGIYYRSGYELKIYRYLDINENVIKWGAEFICIPYKKYKWKKTKWGELVKKTSDHRYFPDVYYELKNSDNSISKIVAEIKPYSEVKEPNIPKKATKKQLENFEYAINMWNTNQFKWEQAIEYCKNRDMKFVIITEKYLNLLK